MRRVPAPIPLAAKREREDVEDDGEPEEAVRGGEADLIPGRIGCSDDSRRHA